MTCWPAPEASGDSGDQGVRAGDRDRRDTALWAWHRLRPLQRGRHQGASPPPGSWRTGPRVRHDRPHSSEAGRPPTTSGPGDLIVRQPWIPQFNIQYYLGLDGISLSLILLTGLVSVLACLASFSIEKQVKGYFSLFLLLTASMTGVFLSLDMFLFYVFFEVMLLPMYFLIAIWGGENREYAAIKFLLYTLFGSVFILVAILILYFWAGDGPGMGRRSGNGLVQAHTFDAVKLAQVAAETGYYGRGVQQLGLRAVPHRLPASSCRRSRSTPGCPTPTSRPRRRSR